MRRRVWIRFEDEVEIDFDRDQFNQWLAEMIEDDETTTYHSLSLALVRIHSFIGGLPDAVLAEMPSAAKNTIADAMRRLAGRLVGEVKSGLCCDSWAKSAESGTDNEGYESLRGQLEHTSLLIGCELPPVRFCPWCGAEKETKE